MATTFDEHFNVLTGLESAVARVRLRILTARGEWVLRPQDGIPYTEDVFSSRQASRIIDVIKRHVRQVEDVTDVEITVQPPPSERTLSLLVELETIYGSSTFGVEVG